MAAKDGETFESDVSSSFKVNSGDVLYSSKDAYITKNSNENSGNENLVKLSYGQKNSRTYCAGVRCGIRLRCCGDRPRCGVSDKGACSAGR